MEGYGYARVIGWPDETMPPHKTVIINDTRVSLDLNYVEEPTVWKSLSSIYSLKEALRHRSCILKKLAKLFKIIISNPFQPSPSSAILAPFCFRINPLVFFFFSKTLFSGFPTLELKFRPSRKLLKILWCSSFNYFNLGSKELISLLKWIIQYFS